MATSSVSSNSSVPILPPNPGVRLVTRRVGAEERTWAQALPVTGRWRVTGAAGSGVTSFLVDTVVDKFRSGADPDGVLVIAASKEAGARLRTELHDRLLAEDVCGREGSFPGYVASAPLVRSIHSLAFALLRQLHEEQIRLITGAEQDGVIRELLSGHAADGRGQWPGEIRPALTYVGFARQLRDLLLRAVERGLSPEDLEELGIRFHRPLWTGAGTFLREYEQTMALAGTHNYSASELVAAVLEKDLPTPWHTVIVDDAQLLDPKSGELVSRLLPSGTDGLTVIGGDPEQSVFHFRGASTAFYREFNPDSGHDVDLGSSRREPLTRIVVADSVATENGLVADFARRAHLQEGVRWSDIAVVVRSTAQIGRLRRALLSAGVPVRINPTDVVLSEQHLVSAVLLGVRALTQELSTSELQQLVIGPVGGADPVTLRRLLRGLRRYRPDARGMDTLAELLLPAADLPDFGEVLTRRELDILTRLRGVLAAGRAVMDQQGSVEEILWAVWQATGLSDRLLATALRGGATGSQADRDLDAVMALFDSAGDFVERHPGTASVTSFVDHVREQELPTGVRDRRSAVPEAVSLLTAHGSVGQEFHTVIVAGVQENSWPTLSETGSLFEQEDLLDYVDRGIHPDTPVSHTASRLQEERRLLHVATTRATGKLLVTAVDNMEANEPVEPSRFIDELAAARSVTVSEISGGADHSGAEENYAPGVRILSRSSVVAELRRAVCDPSARSDVRGQAARQLARLADVGISGAAPSQWWSTTVPSTDAPLEIGAGMSPSRIEGVFNCPLRSVLGRLDEEGQAPIAMVRGTLAHSYLEAVSRGVDEEYARLLTVDALRKVLSEPEWRVPGEISSFERLLERTNHWLVTSRSAFTQLGVEVPVRVDITEGVRIDGRMDRLEEDSSGNAYVVDLKTGKSPATKELAQANMQLAAYQLALSRGEFVDGEVKTATSPDTAMVVGGASLVYPGTGHAAVPTREQTPRTEEELNELAAMLPRLQQEMAGPRLIARINSTCSTCPITGICPVQSQGSTVTDG